MSREDLPGWSDFWRDARDNLWWRLPAVLIFTGSMLRTEGIVAATGAAFLGVATGMAYFPIWRRRFARSSEWRNRQQLFQMRTSAAEPSATMASNVHVVSTESAGSDQQPEGPLRNLQ